MVELEDIRRLRRRLSMTQGDLAKKAGVSQSLIAKIESGKIDPTYSKARRILEALDSLTNQQAKASDILNRRVISIKPENSLKQAIQKMKRYEISQMPVIRNKKVMGLVSEAIIVDAFMKGRNPTTKVRDIMHDCPPTISATASLRLVSSLLREYPIILVMRKGKLLGHITKSDVLTKAFS